MSARPHVFAVCFSIVLAMSDVAFATPPKSSTPQPATPLPVATALSVGFGSAVDPGGLDASRGGTDTVTSNMTLSGTTANNNADHVVTGTNSISGGAFSNLNGIPIVIQNSGANVLIQNATIINLKLN